MERAGEKLKRVRERLRLTYRDVERASQRIAVSRGNDEFSIALSRLADIEHKGTVPTIFRLYSLCAIYRLDICEVMTWYGVHPDGLAAEAVEIPLDRTHLVNFEPHGVIPVPQPQGEEFDPTRTTLLNHLVRRWGKAGLGLLNGLDLRGHRYGMIGTDDWSMYPLLHPGSLVLINEARRKVVSTGWGSELERPIYFLEARDGYRCGWFTSAGGKLIYQPHPASGLAPETFPAADVDLIGQVTGVAMRLERRAPQARN
jgi:hypothetical protein